MASVPLTSTTSPYLLLLDIDGNLNALRHKSVWAGEGEQPGLYDPELMLSRNWKTVVDDSIKTDPEIHYLPTARSMDDVGYPETILFLLTELLEDIQRVHEEDNGVQVAFLSSWNKDIPLFAQIAKMSVPYIPLGKPHMSGGEVEQKRSTVRDFLNQNETTPHVVWFDDVIFGRDLRERTDLLDMLGGRRKVRVEVGNGLMLTPEPQYGISREQWRKAKEFLNVS